MKNSKLVLHMSTAFSIQEIAQFFAVDPVSYDGTTGSPCMAVGNFGPVKISVYKSWLESDSNLPSWNYSLIVESLPHFSNFKLLYIIRLCKEIMDEADVRDCYMLTYDTGQTIFKVVGSKISIAEELRDDFSKFPLPFSDYDICDFDTVFGRK